MEERDIIIKTRLFGIHTATIKGGVIMSLVSHEYGSPDFYKVYSLMDSPLHTIQFIMNHVDKDKSGDFVDLTEFI